MSTGQAPLLLLDLATAQMRERRRAQRDLISRASLRRIRAASTPATRSR